MRPNRGSAARSAVRLGGTVAVLLLGEAAIWLGLVPEEHVPRPTSVAAEFATLVGQVNFWSAIGSTLQGWAVGLVITIAVAVPLGLVLGTSQLVYRMFHLVIEFLRPVPPIALLPVAVLVYGNTVSMKVFLVVVGAFWPLLIQTIYGVRDTDPVSLDTAKVYGLSRLAQLRVIILPSALPYVFTGLRIAATTALVLAVGAELVVGVPGLGSEMTLAYNSGAVLLTYALVVAAGLLGIGTNYTFRAIERAVLHWHPSHRKSG